jgi:uncharacterized sulfatase
MRRRDLLTTTAAALPALRLRAQTPRPNILWLTCEDISPNLGCYGDSYAVTPNLDALANRSLRYRIAWSNAPVCAPARTTIISGMYPPSFGGEHMRSFTKLAPGQWMYPATLREAGYYCTNNSKTDYNLEETGKVWDESSNKAHWRKRPTGRPFFSIFNYVISHESQIRNPHKLVHDPAKVRLPAYHPDTPEVRHDWAQYYDRITEMDAMAGAQLRQLEEDGLAEDTIVFFYSDHGSGMPRSKRWPYDSGLHVPLMVHIPEKWKHLAPKEYKPGGTTDRLVSFVDLAPTLLSLAGIPKPAHYQGHAFLGPHAEPEQPYIYGFRGRMDERYDLVRSVRDKRYVYIRNYMPHRIYGQYIAYMFQTPTTRKWKELYDEGKLNEAQKHFWETKPAEELYDLETDRDEIHNLADSTAHREILERMRRAQLDLALKIRDVGFLPETEMYARAHPDAPYTMGHDPSRYPVGKVIAMAGLATRAERPKDEVLTKGLQDSDSAVRYWAAVGLMISGAGSVTTNAPALEKALTDKSDAVRIAAAEALARYGSAAQTRSAIEVLLELANLDAHGVYTAILALNSLDNIGSKVQGYEERIVKLPQVNDTVNPRMKGYIPNLIAHLTTKNGPA